ncbi:MAG: type II secretion system minor pseudopilin GspK [Myxococcota bacterium]
MLVRLAPRHRRGVVLAMVLILALIFSSAIITFIRQSMVDTLITRNRDARAQAEALARGGVRIAMALVLDDLLLEADPENQHLVGATLDDRWAQLETAPIPTEDGGLLVVQIRDSGARLNLNALVDHGEAAEDLDQTESEEYLVALLEKVIDEMPVAAAEKFYEPRELARNLIDYIDPNKIRTGGRGGEDDYYQAQDPPYRAANRPLLSVGELHLVEGFDAQLVTALEPYVTVYPLAGTQGINVNTAPGHALTALFAGTTGDRRLISSDAAKRILQLREQGTILCDQTETDSTRCALLGEAIDGSLYPPVALPTKATTFEVIAEATVGDVTRRLEVVIDRSNPSTPRLLSWRYR